jgi:hypothetical protein
MRLTYLLALSLFMVSIGPSNARVTQLEIIETIPIANGKNFGDIGAYEKISGIAYFEIAPDHKRNKTIADINRAPVNANGNVEFSAEFEILRPVNSKKASGLLFIETPAQGQKLSLGLLHDIDSQEDLNLINKNTNLGNGFLFNRGHTVAWIAWQDKISNTDHRLVVDFPLILENENPIQGFILTEFNGRSFEEKNPYTLPLSGRQYVQSYPTVSTDKDVAKASLFVMQSGSTNASSPDVGKGEKVPDDQWDFAYCPEGWPGQPSLEYICVKNSFLKNRNYHLIYQAKGASVMGLGLATTRDFISHLKHAGGDTLGGQNPTTKINHVICQGIGQGARYLRDFLYQGFNVDVNGKKVCDGMNIHGAGVEKTYLNYRFSQPYRISTQHSERFIPDVNFPRQYSVRVNPFLKFPDGILKKPAFDPKIFHTDTSTDFWQSRASLVSASEGATMDFSESSRVRRFLISSSESYNRFNGIAHNGYGGRQCFYDTNNLHIGSLMRALINNLELWVVNGEEPLDSIYPKISEETLVELTSLRLPSIIEQNFRGALNGSGDMEFGPRVKFNRGMVDLLIPEVIARHKVLVPAVDQLGHDIAGIRHPHIEVPMGTYLGWNIRTTEFGGGGLCDEHGSFIPLSMSDEDADLENDSRPSLLSLYPDYMSYVNKLRDATDSLVSKNLLLQEDADLLLQRVEESIPLH